MAKGRVVRGVSVVLHPQAHCEQCDYTTTGPDALMNVRAHVRTHHDHEMTMVHRVVSTYQWEGPADA